MRKFIPISLSILLLGLALATALTCAEQSGTITSTDATGTTEINEFLPTQTVYAKGEGMEPGNYIIYIVPDVSTWTPWVTVIPASVTTPTPVTVGPSATFGPTVIWSPTLTPGDYDIIADHQTLGTQGTYDVHDALDSGEIHVTAGFFVIPEIPLGAITVLLVCFAAASLKRRKIF